MRNFVRKWGTVVLHDKLMKPIIPPKYNISMILLNTSMSLLEILEPWADITYVDSSFDYEPYIRKEQTNTTYNLNERVLPKPESLPPADIFITIDCSKFSNTELGYLQQMGSIIEQSGEPGKLYNLGNMSIRVNKRKNSVNKLINV